MIQPVHMETFSLTTSHETKLCCRTDHFPGPFPVFNSLTLSRLIAELSAETMTATPCHRKFFDKARFTAHFYPDEHSILALFELRLNMKIITVAFRLILASQLREFCSFPLFLYQITNATLMCV